MIQSQFFRLIIQNSPYFCMHFCFFRLRVIPSKKCLILFPTTDCSSGLVLFTHPMTLNESEHFLFLSFKIDLKKVLKRNQFTFWPISEVLEVPNANHFSEPNVFSNDDHHQNYSQSHHKMWSIIQKPIKCQMKGTFQSALNIFLFQF